MGKRSARLASMAAGTKSNPKKAMTAKKKSEAPAKKSANKPSATGTTSQGPIRKRKRKRRQSEANKALKRKEAAKKARRSGAEEDDEEAPEPIKVYNDELKTTGLEWEVETIIDSKKVKGGVRYLVKWKGWESSHSTWEPAVHLRNALELISEFDDANPLKP